MGVAIKWLEREADHYSLSTIEVKNAWSYTSTHICLHDVEFKHRMRLYVVVPS